MDAERVVEAQSGLREWSIRESDRESLVEVVENSSRRNRDQKLETSLTK